MPEQGKISAVIITKNEQRNIDRCLDSLIGIADEVIVVDSGSTDKTQAIAEKYEAKFISHEWEGYSKTKNYANSLAQYDYILSLDADEAISPDLMQSILLAKHDLDGAYNFNRLTNYCGKFIWHCGWYPDKKIRLFKKGDAEWQGEYVHEELVLNDGVKLTHLKGDLLHYSVYTLEEHKATIEKYSRLHAQKNFSKGKTTNMAKAYLGAVWNFIKQYFIKAGVLDGKSGFMVCWLSSGAVVKKHKYLMELYAKQ